MSGVIEWLGPLFYPPIGSIAVMTDGDRVEVWPTEDDGDGDGGGFCGLQITGRGAGDVSCFWDRSQIARVESPNDADRQTGWLTTSPAHNDGAGGVAVPHLSAPEPRP